MRISDWSSYVCSSDLLSQPWRFVRVETPALRERLAVHVDAQVAKAGKMYEGEEDRLYRSLKLHGLREAPVLFAVYCDEGTETGHRLGAITMPEARRYRCVMATHKIGRAHVCTPVTTAQLV